MAHQSRACLAQPLFLSFLAFPSDSLLVDTGLSFNYSYHPPSPLPSYHIPPKRYQPYSRLSTYSSLPPANRCFSSTMLVSSSTNSSYSSSNSSSDLHLPYIHPQPSSTFSFGSQFHTTTRQQSRMPIKYRRFYSSPLDESSDSTPLQLYGLEQREPSIMEKPRLLHRVSNALDDIKEDFSLQIDPRSSANKIKRRSTFFDGTVGPHSRPETADGSFTRSPPRSIVSMDAYSLPQRRLTRRLSRHFSVFSRHKSMSSATTISPPNLIGSSTHFDRNQSQTTII